MDTKAGSFPIMNGVSNSPGLDKTTQVGRKIPLWKTTMLGIRICAKPVVSGTQTLLASLCH